MKVSKNRKDATGEKKEIDYGKISALHNAGWNGDKIADEMRLSKTEYTRALTDLLDALDEKIIPLERRYRAVVKILKS